MNLKLRLAIFVAGMALSFPGYALRIAVFGDNATDNFINSTYGAGSATLVTDAQLSTPGFLNNYDAFYYTRNGTSLGQSLSAAAVANVSSYVGARGNVVLMNGDFADALGSSPFVQTLVTNAVNFATSTGHGYIGEFNGAFAGLSSNSNSLTPIGLIPGAGGALTTSGITTIAQAAAGVNHPVTAGLTFPTDPPDVELGVPISGINTNLVLATYAGGAPAIIARQGALPRIAVFGDNATNDFINAQFGPGSATLVTDAQLATPGFLNVFDAFYYTRNGTSLGTSLSAAAAANVESYVGGNGSVVLLNADFADALGSSPFVDTLTRNAVLFAAESGHGYIGEFNGAFAALNSNSSGLRPLGIIDGAAGAFTTAGIGAITPTAAGSGNALLRGLTFPTDPDSVELSVPIAGLDPNAILAQFAGAPAVIARQGQEAAPIRVAVFGDNATDDFIRSRLGSLAATLVTDAQLATPGFLDAFDAFYYTRNGTSLGVSLSAAAAANVQEYLGPGSEIVLLNADFADGLSSPFVQTLTENAVRYAAASGHGYIGEFVGSFSALTSNASNFRPLDIVDGVAGPFTTSGIGPINPAAGTHALLAGLTFPTDPADVELSVAITGLNPSAVIASFQGAPAIISFRVPPGQIPEPGSLALIAVSLLGFLTRRRARAVL